MLGVSDDVVNSQEGNSHRCPVFFIADDYAIVSPQTSRAFYPTLSTQTWVLMTKMCKTTRLLGSRFIVPHIVQ